MKNLHLTIVLILLTFGSISAQKINSEKVFGGYKYTQNGELLTLGDMESLMQTNNQAIQLIKKAKSANTFAQIFGGAGGALIGWPIGTALGGGEANWTLAAIGAGLIVVAIPIAKSSNKKTQKAVGLYNTSLQKTSFFKCQTEYHFISNANGIGLSVNF